MILSLVKNLCSGVWLMNRLLFDVDMFVECLFVYFGLVLIICVCC